MTGAREETADRDYESSTAAYLYTFVFTDDNGEDFVAYGITHHLGRCRYHFECHLAVRGFQYLRFIDGAQAAYVARRFHEQRTASGAPYPNSQVDGTQSEAFPLSDFGLCTTFNHHWIAADAIANRRYSFRSFDGELIRVEGS